MTVQDEDRSIRQQVRTLLSVLAAGVIGAFILALFLLYHYGPTGRYTAHHALLEPSLVTTLSYNDYNRKTGSQTRFISNGIEFNYYDPTTRKQNKIAVSPEKYSTFYQIIASEGSMLEPPTEVVTAFGKAVNASLAIMVRTESHAAWLDDIKVFQQVDFAPQGDYFRIQLHEASPTGNLIYFYRPGIYQTVLQLFTTP